MTPDEVKKTIEDGIPGAEVLIEGEGCNLKATVISKAFEGKSMVEEHKMVYALVNDYIRSGALHALAIKAYTPAEWAQRNS